MRMIRTTVMFGLIPLVAFSLNLFAQEQNTEKGFTPNWGNFKPYENVEEKATSNLVWDLNSVLELGDLPPARFLTVDPMADMYPHMTPYHYALNNPLRFIDPTGMWTASYDSSGNAVNVTAEEGDNLEGLYSQLGITAEQFAEQYRISDMENYSIVTGQTAFDITSRVIANTGFDANFKGSNCHGFVCVATGATLTEAPVGGRNLLTQLGTTEQVMTPTTGNVAVFPLTGDLVQNDNSITLSKNDPAHSAIFIVKNQAGQSQYLNRMNTGKPVTVNTGGQIVTFFNGLSKQYAPYVKSMPTVSPNPIFYRR